MNTLSVRSLRTYYFTYDGIVKAVDDFDLEVASQNVVGLVGESGCGKSTLGLSIMRLVQDPGRIVGGQIMFGNRDLTRLSDREIMKVRGREISMIFQDPMTYLNPVMKVGDQIAEAIKHFGKSKEQSSELAKELLKKVGAPDIENHYPHQLSGGLRQRVLIGIALAGRPTLIIADEPTTALDVTVQAQILDLLKELIRETESSMLLITHNLGLVAEMCDFAYVMYAGKLVESADIYDLFYDSRHPYTAALLQSAKSIQQLREEIVAIPGAPPNLIDPPSGCRFHPRCESSERICAQEEPNLIEIRPGHNVKCRLYE